MFSGQVNCASRIAYVPQTAWMQHLSLRENILFGRKMDQKKYNTVVKACALKLDFDSLVFFQFSSRSI
jgi:ATP-binding cassette subfamily C (CFTR/MRP) protein 1